MIAHIDQWGPFVEGLVVAQRRGRLRLLGYLIRFHCGSREPELLQLIVEAETDASALEPAMAALNSLPRATRQNVLAAYANIPVQA